MKQSEFESQIIDLKKPEQKKELTPREKEELEIAQINREYESKCKERWRQEKTYKKVELINFNQYE